VRRIFIGDIQGCSNELERLLDRLGPGNGDRLYCVGDLVNRGPDSAAVLRRLRALGARSVLGNHDLHLLRLAAGSTPGTTAGELDCVLAAPDRAELLDWLRQQPILLHDDDVVLVHAGLHPSWSDITSVAAALNGRVAAYVAGCGDDDIDFATQVRYCDANGRRPMRDDPPPGTPFAPWDRWYRGRNTVVFGHWSRRGLVCETRRRGLDTGCVYGGRLTAWVAETDRFVQVDARTASH
jgi:bis(5'-nucleosyl)-tetraphosphatase (symmetrical)